MCLPLPTSLCPEEKLTPSAKMIIFSRLDTWLFLPKQIDISLVAQAFRFKK